MLSGHAIAPQIAKALDSSILDGCDGFVEQRAPSLSWQRKWIEGCAHSTGMLLHETTTAIKGGSTL